MDKYSNYLWAGRQHTVIERDIIALAVTGMS